MGNLRHEMATLVAASLLAWAGSSSAQDYKVRITPPPRASAPAEDAAADSGAKGDESPGVVGGYSWGNASKGKPAPRARRAPRIEKQYDRGTPIVTYPGFRALPDGTALIWVQVSQKVSVQVERAKGSATYLLDGAHVQILNNTHALVTSHFATPVAATQLRPGAAGARLVVHLREHAEPEHEVIEGPRGSMLLRIRVPRATTAPGTPAAPAAATTPARAPRGDMSATAPDPKPRFQTQGNASAEVEAGASLQLGKKDKKRNKRKKRRGKRRKK